MGQLHSTLPAQRPRPLVGVSPWVRRIQAEVKRVAPYTSSVLITGPSGTGKEVIARAIHAQSPRRDAPFIAVNCAALARSLFESQMFGHLKGSFTGARFATLGCFRAAEGGTLFLDEIGELEPDLQAKLLRVLQENVVVPVGSHEELPIDVRVVAATNRELLAEVAEKRFRKDLYYRLAVVSLHSLPLRERLEDMEVLSQYLLSRIATTHDLPFKPLGPGAMAALRAYHWPGNVRELQNVLERGLLLAQGELIAAEDIVFDEQPDSLTPPVESASAGPSDCDQRADDLRSRFALPANNAGRWPTIEEVERWHIRVTLEHTRYNQTAAARLLGIHRNVLRRRMERYGLLPQSEQVAHG